MTDPSAPSKPHLRDHGQVYVTLAAAEAYAEQRRLRVEEARRELTEILVRDGRGDGPTGGEAARYRARSRATQMDVTARVVREGLLLVVVAIEARDYNR